MQISLKAARVNANMTQREAAKRLDVDVSTLVNWETGKTFPKAHMLSKLCGIYNIPIDHIFLKDKSS